MTVRITARTAFEPDALVVCSPAVRPQHDGNPESGRGRGPVADTAADDHGVKLDGYFSLPSVEHYLILDPDRRVMIHHKRGADAIETALLRDGLLQLDPPGLEAEVTAAFFVPE